ncbi:hypothetical protein PVAP13_3NG279246 [Panicum virgatum]|uniref:Uncharacterized protein n=1 Tax=Panicum virgatum TaxID=38727 RepID=A0A8T0UN27_PANVG|nr:hypothetical protein PVAP13_3NG279246 [Panicum virgatum]
MKRSVAHMLIDMEPVEFVRAVANQSDKINMMDAANGDDFGHEFFLSMSNVTQAFDGNLDISKFPLIHRPKSSLSQLSAEVIGCFSQLFVGEPCRHPSHSFKWIILFHPLHYCSSDHENEEADDCNQNRNTDVVSSCIYFLT